LRADAVHAAEMWDGTVFDNRILVNIVIIVLIVRV